MPAAASRGRRPGSTPRPGSKAGVPRWLWIVGAGVLVLAIYLVYTRRASGSLNTSGSPGPDLTGSAAGTGGASSTGDPLGPNSLTEQVQTTDTTPPDGSTPTMTAAGPFITTPQFKTWQQQLATQQQQHQQYATTLVNTIADTYPATTPTTPRFTTTPTTPRFTAPPAAPTTPKPRLPGLRGGF